MISCCGLVLMGCMLVVSSWCQTLRLGIQRSSLFYHSFKSAFASSFSLSVRVNSSRRRLSPPPTSSSTATAMASLICTSTISTPTSTTHISSSQDTYSTLVASLAVATAAIALTASWRFMLWRGRVYAKRLHQDVAKADWKDGTPLVRDDTASCKMVSCLGLTSPD